MATTENIIDLSRNLIRAESGSDVPVATNAFMYEAIMDGETKWADAFNQTGEEPTARRVDKGYDLVADTDLDEASDLPTTDTQFTVTDANDFDASDGAVVIWDDSIPDVVYYTTWTSGTKTFSGVTGLAFAHEDEDAVQKLYKLPSDFGSFREEPGYGDGVYCNGELRYTGGVPGPGFFRMLDNGTNKFLWLPRGVTGSASVLYNATRTTIDSLDDVVDVPEQYKFFLVWHCVAFYFMGGPMQDPQKMLMAQTEADKVLNRALRNRNTGKKIRTRPFGRPARDYVMLNGNVIPLI